MRSAYLEMDLEMLISLGRSLLFQSYFCAAYGHAENYIDLDLSKCFLNPKSKLWVTTHFVEIIKLQFGTKFYTLFRIFTFSNYYALIKSEKCLVVLNIFFFNYNFPCLDLLFPHCPKNTSVLRGTVLKV